MVKKIVFLGVSLFFSAIGMDESYGIEQLTREELNIALKKIEMLKTADYFRDRCESARQKELQQINNSFLPKKDDNTEKK